MRNKHSWTATVRIFELPDGEAMRLYNSERINVKNLPQWQFTKKLGYLNVESVGPLECRNCGKSIEETIVEGGAYCKSLEDMLPSELQSTLLGESA
jgi:hypothetical protein